MVYIPGGRFDPRKKGDDELLKVKTPVRGMEPEEAAPRLEPEQEIAPEPDPYPYLRDIAAPSPQPDIQFGAPSSDQLYAPTGAIDILRREAAREAGEMAEEGLYARIRRMIDPQLEVEPGKIDLRSERVRQMPQEALDKLESRLGRPLSEGKYGSAWDDVAPTTTGMEKRGSLMGVQLGVQTDKSKKAEKIIEEELRGIGAAQAVEALTMRQTLNTSTVSTAFQGLDKEEREGYEETLEEEIRLLELHAKSARGPQEQLHVEHVIKPAIQRRRDDIEESRKVSAWDESAPTKQEIESYTSQMFPLDRLLPWAWYSAFVNIIYGGVKKADDDPGVPREFSKNPMNVWDSSEDRDWLIKPDENVVNRMKVYMGLAIAPAGDEKAGTMYRDIPEKVREQIFNGMGPTDEDFATLNNKDFRKKWEYVRLGSTILLNQMVRDSLLLRGMKTATGENLDPGEKKAYLQHVYNNMKVLPYSKWKNLTGVEMVQMGVPIVPMKDMEYERLYERDSEWFGYDKAKERGTILIRNAEKRFQDNPSDLVALHHMTMGMMQDAKSLVHIPLSLAAHKTLGGSPSNFVAQLAAAGASPGYTAMIEAFMAKKGNATTDTLIRSVQNYMSPKNHMSETQRIFAERFASGVEDLQTFSFIELQSLWNDVYDSQMDDQDDWSSKLSNAYYSAGELGRGLVYLGGKGLEHTSRTLTSNLLYIPGFALEKVGETLDIPHFEGAGEALQEEGMAYWRPTERAIRSTPAVMRHYGKYLWSLRDPERLQHAFALNPFGTAADLTIARDLTAGSLLLMGKGTSKVGKKWGTWKRSVDKEAALRSVLPEAQFEAGEIVAVYDHGFLKARGHEIDFIKQAQSRLDAAAFKRRQDPTAWATRESVASRALRDQGVPVVADEARLVSPTSGRLPGEHRRGVVPERGQRLIHLHDDAIAVREHMPVTYMATTLNKGERLEKLGNIMQMGVREVAKATPFNVLGKWLPGAALKSRLSGNFAGRLSGWFSSADAVTGPTVQQILHDRSGRMTHNISIAAEDINRHWADYKTKSLPNTIRDAFDHHGNIISEPVRVKGEIQINSSLARHVFKEDELLSSMTKKLAADDQFYSDLLVGLSNGKVKRSVVKEFSVTVSNKEGHPVNLSLVDLGLTTKNGTSTALGRTLGNKMKKGQLEYEVFNRELTKNLHDLGRGVKNPFVLEDENRLIRVQSDASGEVFHIDADSYLEQIHMLNEDLVKAGNEIMGDNAIGIDPNRMWLIDHKGVKRNLEDMNYVRRTQGGYYVPTDILKDLINNSFHNSMAEESKLAYKNRTTLTDLNRGLTQFQLYTELFRKGHGDTIVLDIENPQFLETLRVSTEVDEGRGTGALRFDDKTQQPMGNRRKEIEADIRRNFQQAEKDAWEHLRKRRWEAQKATRDWEAGGYWYWKKDGYGGKKREWWTINKSNVPKPEPWVEPTPYMRVKKWKFPSKKKLAERLEAELNKRASSLDDLPTAKTQVKIKERRASLRDVIRGENISRNGLSFDVKPYAVFFEKDEISVLKRILEVNKRRVQQENAKALELFKKEHKGKRLTMVQEAELKALTADYQIKAVELKATAPQTKFNKRSEAFHIVEAPSKQVLEMGKYKSPISHSPHPHVPEWQMKGVGIEVDGKLLTQEEAVKAVREFEANQKDIHKGVAPKDIVAGKLEQTELDKLRIALGDEADLILDDLKRGRYEYYDLKEIDYIRGMFNQEKLKTKDGVYNNKPVLGEDIEVSMAPYRKALNAMEEYSQTAFNLRSKRLQVPDPVPKSQVIKDLHIKTQEAALKRNPLQTAKVALDVLSNEAKNQLIAWRKLGAPTKALTENHALMLEMHRAGVIELPPAYSGMKPQLTPVGAAIHLYEFDLAIPYFEGLITKGFIMQQELGLNQTRVFGPLTLEANTAFHAVANEYFPDMRIKQALLVKALHTVQARKRSNPLRVALEKIEISDKDLIAGMQQHKRLSEVMADSGLSADDFLDEARDFYPHELGEVKLKIARKKYEDEGLGEIPLEEVPERKISAWQDEAQLIYNHEVWQGLYQRHLQDGYAAARTAKRSIEKSSNKFEIDLTTRQKELLSANNILSASPELSMALANNDMFWLIKEMELLDSLIDDGVARVMSEEARSSYFPAFNYPSTLGDGVIPAARKKGDPKPRWVPFAEVASDLENARWIVEDSRLNLYEGQNLVVPINIAWELGLVKDTKNWMRSNITDPKRGPLWDAPLNAVLDMTESLVHKHERFVGVDNPLYAHWVTNKVIRVGFIQGVQNTVSNTLLIASSDPLMLVNPRFHFFVSDFYQRFPYGGKSKAQWTDRDRHVFANAGLEQINQAITGAGVPKGQTITVHPDIQRQLANSEAANARVKEIREAVKDMVDGVNEGQFKTTLEYERWKKSQLDTISQMHLAEDVHNLFERFIGEDGLLTDILKSDPEVIMMVAERNAPMQDWIKDFLGMRAKPGAGVVGKTVAPITNFAEFSNPYLVAAMEKGKKTFVQGPRPKGRVAGAIWDKQKAAHAKRLEAGVDKGVAVGSERALTFGKVDSMTSAMQYLFWSTDAKFRWAIGQVGYDKGLRGIELRNFIEKRIPDMGRRSFAHRAGSAWSPLWSWRAKAAWALMSNIMDKPYHYVLAREIRATASESEMMSDQERFSLITNTRGVNADSLIKMGAGHLSIPDINATLGQNFWMGVWNTGKSAVGGRWGELGKMLSFDAPAAMTHPSLSIPLVYVFADLAANHENYYGDGMLDSFKKWIVGMPKGSAARRMTETIMEQRHDAWDQGSTNKMLMIASELLGHKWYPFRDPEVVGHRYLHQILNRVEQKWKSRLHKYWVMKSRLISKTKRPENLTPHEVAQLKWLDSHEVEYIRAELKKAWTEVFNMDQEAGSFVRSIIRKNSDAWLEKARKDMQEKLERGEATGEHIDLSGSDVPPMIDTPTVVPGAQPIVDEQMGLHLYE